MSGREQGWIPAYIGLGSNLNDPARQIQQALQALAQLPASRLVAHSSLYSSQPVGPQDQPDYINAAALLETRLSALALLDELQRIEQTQGRIRGRRWGERTLDLDILLYGNQQLDLDRLRVPHKELANRDFVLLPLLEISPHLCLPDGSALSLLLQACPSNQLRRLT